MSDYQGTIDWTSVASSGVVYAFIRVSDGLDFPDTSFSTYWADSRTAGVIHGAYQYFEPAQDPVMQADMLLSAMGPMQANDLPPVIDVETTGGLDETDLAAAIQAWVAHVQQAIGRPPIIYTGSYFWDDNVAANMSSSPLWHAQYTTASCPDISASWTNWAFWQYDDAGTVSGISGGGVDMDWWNGDMTSLTAFLGPGGPCGVIPSAGGVIAVGSACFEDGGPATGLRTVAGAGEDGGTLIWTHTTDDDAEQNFAQWNLDFAVAGSYRIDAYTNTAYAQSKMADYHVVANGQDLSFTIDQAAVNGWQTLGNADFAAGGSQYINLGDNTGEASSTNTQLVFDAIRLVPADATGSSGTGSGVTGGGGGGGGDGGGDPGTDHRAGCAAGGANSPALLGLGLLVLLRRRRSTR